MTTCNGVPVQPVIDPDDPCAILRALKGAKAAYLMGGTVQRVRIEGFEVQYSAASAADLDNAILRYESLCAQAQGGLPRRFAIRAGAMRS